MTKRSTMTRRQFARAAAETGVATQLGNQGRSTAAHRLTCEWIWNDAVGQVREVHAWSGAGGWATGRGRPARSRFEYGAPLTEFVLLGAAAVRAKQRIQWDGQHMTVTNVPAARRLVRETYRQGFDLEKV